VAGLAAAQHRSAGSSCQRPADPAAPERSYAIIGKQPTVLMQCTGNAARCEHATQVSRLA